MPGKQDGPSRIIYGPPRRPRITQNAMKNMYIDMGERIAGKQDRFSMIIEDPLRATKIPPKYTFFSTFWPINEKMVFKLLPLVVHMSPLR